ncbi:thermonuclease family protein [Curvibacter sp. APW13]|uniref:thermonuclease family protein n=1 Tax=Curvibacter sp. APW13 TaxID=3077236 RepID=UPI0028DDC734|nr:thermonuclease family protein [Curvibacter sp. APW13]MDT8992812.1 thermonuclease family protein [Curvibacter sp. APW13]
MKKAIALVALLAAATWAHAQFTFELEGQVAYIDDGDTIILHPGSQRIRLAEIDAPETDHGPGKPGQPYGTTARAALTAMMPVGSEVKAQCYEHDAHGRAVCRVMYQNVDISLEMARLGHAHAYKEYVRDPRIIGAADYAKARQLGLWNAGNAVYPQTWRRSCWTEGSQPLFCSTGESSNAQPVLVTQPVPSVTPHPTATTQQVRAREVINGLTKYLALAFELLKTVPLP